MRPRHSDVLKEFGYTGDLETFRATLLEVKTEQFPGITDEELIISKDGSAGFCVLVRKKLGAPRLGRAFILRSLIGLRKSRKVRRAVH